jgi:hypothetical protein
MSGFLAAVDRVLEALSSEQWRDACRMEAQAVIGLRRRATQAELDEGVRRLVAEIDPEYAEVSGLLALTAGAIVEGAGDVRPLGNRILEALPAVLANANRFGVLAVSRALSEEESESIDDDSGGEWIAGRFVSPDQIGALHEEDLDAADAWTAMSSWMRPAVACFTRDADLRRRAVPMLPALRQLESLNDNARCLVMLLEVHDDEPYLVFHPATGTGFRLRVSGVADNFQLHTLLADVLLRRDQTLLRFLKRRLKGEPPHPLAAAVARGEGPQQADVPSHGVWDLYQWTALSADGSLPPLVATDHWIWGEGIPADIRPFEGHRVVLLAPPMYPRSWNTSRFFDALPASITVEEALAKEASETWLERLGRAAEELRRTR